MSSINLLVKNTDGKVEVVEFIPADLAHLEVDTENPRRLRVGGETLGTLWTKADLRLFKQWLKDLGMFVV